MKAIRLDPLEKDRAAKIWAHSFFDYPLMTYCWPNVERRKRYLERYLGWAINYGFRYGEVYTTLDIGGISIWLPPGKTNISFALLVFLAITIPIMVFR